MIYQVHIITEEVTVNTSTNTYSIEEAIKAVCHKFNILERDIHEVKVWPANGDDN